MPLRVGQSHVEKNQIKRLFRQRRVRPSLPLSAVSTAIAVHLQQSLQRLADGGFVIDDQHRAHGATEASLQRYDER